MFHTKQKDFNELGNDRFKNLFTKSFLPFICCNLKHPKFDNLKKERKFNASIWSGFESHISREPCEFISIGVFIRLLRPRLTAFCMLLSSKFTTSDVDFSNFLYLFEV